LNAENENKDESSESSTSTPEVKVETTEEPPKLVEAEAQPVGDIAKDSSQIETLVGGRREDRRNWVENVNKTCDYIGKISRDKSLHFRASDKITSRLLIGSFILALCFAALPFWEMNAIAAFAYVLADVLLLGAITVFVVSRFGIIRAMEPRHALVCWHLMVGTGLLALVIGFNVVAAVVLVMMRERLQLLFPGG
jgi:hypothetical protein